MLRRHDGRPRHIPDDVLIARFDLAAIEAQRRNWCVFRDRRPDLYGALTTLDGGAASSG